MVSIAALHEVREVVQLVQIIAVGTDKKGEPVEVVIASTRRPIPVPYTEEP